MRGWRLSKNENNMALIASEPTTGRFSVPCSLPSARPSILRKMTHIIVIFVVVSIGLVCEGSRFRTNGMNTVSTSSTSAGISSSRAERRKALLDELNNAILERSVTKHVNDNRDEHILRMAEIIFLELSHLEENSSALETGMRLREAWRAFNEVDTFSFLELDVDAPDLNSVIPNSVGVAEKTAKDMVDEFTKSTANDEQDRNILEEAEGEERGITQTSDSSDNEGMSCSGRYNACVKSSEVIRMRCIEAYKMTSSGTARGVRREHVDYFAELERERKSTHESRGDDEESSTADDYGSMVDVNEEAEDVVSDSQSGPSDISKLQSEMMDDAISNMDAMS